MSTAGASAWDDDPAAYEDLVLVDLVDRLLDKGVVISGDITLSVADVDLVHLGLRLLLSSAHTAERVGVSLPSSAVLHKTGLDSDPTGAASLESDALGSSGTASSALDSSALDSSALDHSGGDEEGGDSDGGDGGGGGGPGERGFGSDLGFPHHREP